jgi:hypothetical protein
MVSTWTGTDIAKSRQNDRNRENAGGIQEQLATISLNACNELWTDTEKISGSQDFIQGKSLTIFPFMYRTDVLLAYYQTTALRGLF